MNQKELKQKLHKMGLDNSVVFEDPNYAEAAIGTTFDGQVIYDYDKMVKFLMETDGMTEEDAMDFISYNTIRAIPFAGHLHPIVVRREDE